MKRIIINKIKIKRNINDYFKFNIKFIDTKLENII